MSTRFIHALRLVAHLYLGAALVASAALGIARPPLASAQADVSGALESVNSHSGELQIRTARGVRRGLVDAGTLITVDGFPGTLSDLRPGYRVTVQFVQGSDGRTRVQIARLSVRTR